MIARLLSLPLTLRASPDHAQRALALKLARIGE